MALSDPTVHAAAQLGAGVSGLGFPSIGRLIVGFLFTAGLAVGIAYLVRRYGPLFRRRHLPSSDIRILGRTAVSRTLTVHWIEIDGARLAVAEARSGVAVAAMPPAPPVAQRSSP